VRRHRRATHSAHVEFLWLDTSTAEDCVVQEPTRRTCLPELRTFQARARQGRGRLDDLMVQARGAVTFPRRVADRPHEGGARHRGESITSPPDFVEGMVKAPQSSDQTANRAGALPANTERSRSRSWRFTSRPPL